MARGKGRSRRARCSDSQGRASRLRPPRRSADEAPLIILFGAIFGDFWRSSPRRVRAGRAATAAVPAESLRGTMAATMRDASRRRGEAGTRTVETVAETAEGLRPDFDRIFRVPLPSPSRRRSLLLSSASDVFIELILVNDRARVDSHVGGDLDRLHDDSVHVANVVQTFSSPGGDFTRASTSSRSLSSTSAPSGSSADTVAFLPDGTDDGTRRVFAAWRSSAYGQLPRTTPRAPSSAAAISSPSSSTLSRRSRRRGNSRASLVALRDQRHSAATAAAPTAAPPRGSPAAAGAGALYLPSSAVGAADLAALANRGALAALTVR